MLPRCSTVSDTSMCTFGACRAPWQRIRNFLGRAEAGVQHQRETLGWKDNRHPFMTAALGFFWQVGNRRLPFVGSQYGGMEFSDDTETAVSSNACACHCDGTGHRAATVFGCLAQPCAGEATRLPRPRGRRASIPQGEFHVLAAFVTHMEPNYSWTYACLTGIYFHLDAGN